MGIGQDKALAATNNQPSTDVPPETPTANSVAPSTSV